MLYRKHQLMVKIIVFIILAMIVDPIMVHATGVGEVVVYGSGYSVSEDNLAGLAALAGDINEEEIWAQIDRDELRSLVDVEAVKKSVDVTALLSQIDLDDLMSQIDIEAIEAEIDDSSHPVDVVNIKLPIIGENSPFDFLIDPQGFLYSAASSRNEVGLVEEGAGVLFRNEGEGYKFSGKSDKLTVVNKSNVPVRLSVQASISDADAVSFVNNRSELEGDNASLFMAIGDDEGIRSIITKHGDAIIDVVLDAAPEGSYEFTWNEETQKYDYVLADGFEDEDFDSYSFYISADCNKEADWSKLSVAPRIEVTWRTEVVSEEDKKDAQLEALSADIETLVKDYLGITKEVTKDGKSSEEEIRGKRIIELVHQKLYNLALEQYSYMYNVEVESLIDQEVERLANEKYKALVLEKLGISDMEALEILEETMSEESSQKKVSEGAIEPITKGNSEASEMQEYIRDTDITTEESIEESSDISDDILIIDDDPEYQDTEPEDNNE